MVGNVALFAVLVVLFGLLGSFFGPMGTVLGVGVGAVLAARSSVTAPDGEDRPPGRQGRDCPECGTPTDPGANYCQQCGAAVEVADDVARIWTSGAFRYCSRCGADVSGDPEACPGCGRRFR